MIKEIDYHKVGEEFEYNGRKFKSVDVCSECDLEEECSDANFMSCNYFIREDHRDIIYKEMNSRKKLARAIVVFLAIALCTLFISAIIILFLDSEFILSLLLAMACLFVIVDVYVSRKYDRR